MSNFKNQIQWKSSAHIFGMAKNSFAKGVKALTPILDSEEVEYVQAEDLIL
jgi:hypothetical protein